MIDLILDRAGYWLIIALMMTGLYVAYSAGNLIKRLVGLSVFQTSIFLFFVALGVVAGGTAPILTGADMRGSAAVPAVRVAELAQVYSNPLPHVLMLTAIVVSIATLSVGLALVVRIREAYGTIEAGEIHLLDTETAQAEAAADDAARSEDRA